MSRSGAGADASDHRGRVGFRGDIEGLRALAVVLVVGFHAGAPFLTGGFVGVDVFFVISGYLITALLWAERSQTDSIDLAAFFARRIRRLLPAATVTLLASLALASVILPPLRMVQVAQSATAAAAYASNMHFLRLASDYFHGDVSTNPLLHTWSLAVEEQFYLVWPFALLLIAGRRRSVAFTSRRLAWSLTVVGLVSFVAASWYTSANRNIAFYGMPLRAWEFCCGGIASIVPGAPKDDRSVPSWASSQSRSASAH